MVGKRNDGERCLLCELGRDMLDSDDFHQLCDDCRAEIRFSVGGGNE